MVAQTVDQLGGVDILVTGAGIANRFPAEEFPIDEWQRIMDANVKGTYIACQAVGKRLIGKGGGKIITVGSVRGMSAIRRTPRTGCPRAPSIC